MTENFEKLSPDLEPTYESLRTVEMVESQAERLRLLITAVDRAAFPDQPLEVRVTERSDEPWAEGEEVNLSGYEDEQGTKQWVYEINPVLDTTESIPFDELLGMAMHEVRHRVQRALPVEMAKDKEIFLAAIESWPALVPLKEKIITRLEQREKSTTRKELPPHIEEREFDARVIEIFGPAMMKQGMTLPEVTHDVITADLTYMVRRMAERMQKQ